MSRDGGSPEPDLPRTEAFLAARSRSRRRKLISFAVGILLVIAAAWAAGRNPEVFQQVSASLANAPASLVVLAATLPLLSWLFTTLCFWFLTRIHGRVGIAEMAALMGSSWLLNFLPLKPGLVGRVAYHKTINGIPIAASLKVLAGSILCGGVSIAAALGVALLVRQTAREPGPALAIFALPLAVFLVAGLVGKRLTKLAAAISAVPVGTFPAMNVMLALACRYADLLVWSARYMVAFELVGRPISPGQAVAIAGVSQVVTLLPLIGNGLGLREWAVGLVAAALPAWYVGSVGAPELARGLSADLVNRAFEITAALAVGTLSTLWLGARLRRMGRDAATGLPDPASTTTPSEAVPVPAVPPSGPDTPTADQSARSDTGKPG